jgi:hypothetical protein
MHIPKGLSQLPCTPWKRKFRMIPGNKMGKAKSSQPATSFMAFAATTKATLRMAATIEAALRDILMPISVIWPRPKAKVKVASWD